MLRAIYRAIIIGRTRSAAIYLANNLSERQLNDIGHSKWTLVEKSVENTIKDLDAAKKLRAQKAIQPAPAYSLAGIWAAFMRKAAIQPCKNDRQGRYLTDFQSNAQIIPVITPNFTVQSN